MSDETGKETAEKPADEGAKNEADQEQQEPFSNESGPTFTPGPDPLRGVREGAADLMGRMDGKTVSMKVYVGTIVGIVVLMLLARCGG